jgi:Putative porin
MKTMTKRMLALAGVLALGLTAAKAQTDGALLDALVKKGVLSDQEAEDIRSNEAKDYSTTSAGKLSISDHVTNLKLYGDARLRFEYLDEKPQNSAASAAAGLGNNATTTDRSRYRIRIGADYTFTDNFKAGVELESNVANDSANQTLGNQYGKFGINVGLVYLQWKPYNWVTLTGGKQRNPLYTTDLVWDPDINPEGGSEVLSWNLPLDFGSSAPASTDPKAISAPSEPSDMSLTIGLTGFQGIYADNAEASATPLAGTGVADKTDVWQFVEQVPIQFNFNKTTFIKEVPGFDSYTGGGNAVGFGVADAGGANGGSVPFISPHAADHLQIFTAPGEFDFKAADLPIRFYWDFALNTEGKARVQDVYLGNHNGLAPPGAATPALTAASALAQKENQALGDNTAWLAGVQLGVNKKKGDWSIKADYRQTGLGSVDPNLNDSDFADSFLNQQGVKVQSIYNFTDFLTGSITYFNTWDYKNGLFDGTQGQSVAGLPISTGSTATSGGTASVAAVKSTQRVQVDLQWKF